ncbi:hypothetical protein GCM10027570_14730 [Streptomonospora sediminis]
MEAIVCDTTCQRHPAAPVGVVDRVRGAVLDGTLGRISVLANGTTAECGSPARWPGVVEWTVPARQHQRYWLLATALRRGTGSMLVFDCACDIRPGVVEAFANLDTATALVADRPDHPDHAAAATRREGSGLRLVGLHGPNQHASAGTRPGPAAYLGALLVTGTADRRQLAGMLDRCAGHHPAHRADAAALAPWHDALGSLAQRTRIRCAVLARDVHGDETVIEGRLAGGSHASTYIRLLHCGNRTVRKEAVGAGLAKLNDEVAWLRGLEPTAGRHFPDIVASRAEPRGVSMDLAFHHLPTLRELILSGRIDAEEAALWTRRILAVLRRDLYPAGRRPAPADYVRRTHLDRVEARLAETAAALPDRHRLWTADSLLVNGVRLRGARALAAELACDEQALRMLTPDRLVRTHGDPHFDNVLIDRQNHRFLLIDPRGNTGYDPAYDLGKIWHSTNSLYDLVHTGQVEVAAGNDGIDYAFTSPRLVAFYHRVRERVHAWLIATGWHGDDPHWLLKVRLAEAAHMCSVMPFHIAHDQRETVALACYARGLELLNELRRDLVAAGPRPSRAGVPGPSRRAAVMDRACG